MISSVLCCYYIVILIDSNREYINGLAAFLWLIANVFWVIQDLITIPTYFAKTAIITALLLSIVLALKNKLNNLKTKQ